MQHETNQMKTYNYISPEVHNHGYVCQIELSCQECLSY